MRAGQIDAIANVEPAITMLERSGAIAVVIETMSEQGSRAVFGEPLPAGSLYTREQFIKQNPDTVQALTEAMVRALVWLQKASAAADPRHGSARVHAGRARHSTWRRSSGSGRDSPRTA